MARSYKDHFFLFKVHPAEDFTLYSKVSKKMPRNVLIINTGLASDMFKFSKFHIHYFCTTSIEAMMKGITTCHYQPNNVNNIAQKGLIKEACEVASNTVEIKKLLNKVLGHNYKANNDLKNAQLKLIQKAFGEFIGHSAQKCAQVIKNEYEEIEAKNEASCDPNYLELIDEYHKWGKIGKGKYFYYLVKMLKKELAKLVYKVSNNFTLKKYDPFMYCYPDYRKDIKKVRNLSTYSENPNNEHQ